MSIDTKLIAITQAIQALPKKGYNQHHKYEYHRAQDVMEAVAGKLAEHGISYRFNITDYSNLLDDSGVLTTIKTMHTYTDTEDSTQVTVEGAGMGKDRGDKSLPKAITNATKFHLMQMFLIGTDDDPEADTTTDQIGDAKAAKSYTFERGKFAGKPLSAADDGYLEYMIKQDHSDAGIFRAELERRKK